jgi:hypothetical protein
VCRGEVILKDPVEDLIIEIIGIFRKHFTPKMLANFLLGRYSREIRQGRYDRSSGFGSLSSWNPDDVKDTIHGLISADKVRQLIRGILKGKLTDR